MFTAAELSKDGSPDVIVLRGTGALASRGLKVARGEMNEDHNTRGVSVTLADSSLALCVALSQGPSGESGEQIHVSTDLGNVKLIALSNWSSVMGGIGFWCLGDHLVACSTSILVDISHTRVVSDLHSS